MTITRQSWQFETMLDIYFAKILFADVVGLLSKQKRIIIKSKFSSLRPLSYWQTFVFTLKNIVFHLFPKTI